MGNYFIQGLSLSMLVSTENVPNNVVNIILQNKKKTFWIKILKTIKTIIDPRWSRTSRKKSRPSFASIRFDLSRHSVFLDVPDQRGWRPVRKFHPKEGRELLKMSGDRRRGIVILTIEKSCWRKNILEFL